MALATSSGKPCFVCGEPCTKGNICPKHKRVADNLYNENKKKKDSDPAWWQEFMEIRKQQGDSYVLQASDRGRGREGWQRQGQAD